jgi:hypothetical protein
MGGQDPSPLPDFHLLFESAPGLCLVLDPHLRILAASDSYLQAMMKTREQIVGRDVFEIFLDNSDDTSSSWVQNLRASLERVIQTHLLDTMPVQKYDVHRPGSARSSFEERYWSPVNSPVCGHNHELLYILHRVEDVTDFIHLRQARGLGVSASAQSDAQTEKMATEFFFRAQDLQETNQFLQRLQEVLERTVKERTRELDGALKEWRAACEEKQVLLQKLDTSYVQLQEKIDELERITDAVVNRELKLAALEREVGQLKKELERVKEKGEK